MCFSVHRPHIPVSKLVVSESYDTYISRSYQVTKEIISECKGKGECCRGGESQARQAGMWIPIFLRVFPSSGAEFPHLNLSSSLPGALGTPVCIRTEFRYTQLTRKGHKVKEQNYFRDPYPMAAVSQGNKWVICPLLCVPSIKWGIFPPLSELLLQITFPIKTLEHFSKHNIEIF